MIEKAVIKVSNLNKTYHLYNSPADRVKEAFHPLRRKYHRLFHALHDVSFEVKRGEALGIIGRNGSGKSTLLKIVCGVAAPSSGHVDIKGRLAALLELGAGFNPEFTGRQNVYFNGAILGFSKGEMDARFDEIADFADIGEFIDQPVKTYSSGMYVRLAFAVQVCVEPDVLIVDEALSVGDVFFQQKCFRRIQEIRAKGTTLLFVSHDMPVIQNLCQSAVLLNKGAVQFLGSPVEAASLYFSGQENKKIQAPSLTFKSSIRQTKIDHNADKSPVTSQKKNILDHNILHLAQTSQGDKGMELIAASIQTEQGEYTLDIPCITFATISILARAHEFIPHPNIGFTLIDRLNNLIFSTSAFQKGYKFDSLHPGDERIVVFRVCFSVQPGEYTFSLGCADINHENVHDSLTLHRLIGIGPLKIYHQPSNNELLSFSGIADLKTEISQIC